MPQNEAKSGPPCMFLLIDKIIEGNVQGGLFLQHNYEVTFTSSTYNY